MKEPICRYGVGGVKRAFDFAWFRRFRLWHIISRLLVTNDSGCFIEGRFVKKNIVLIIAATLLASCSTIQSDKAGDKITQLIPLQVGNYWKFIDQEGADYNAEIREKISIDGSTWYKYWEFSDDDIYYVRNSLQGQLEIDLETQEKVLVLPYPVENEMTYSQYDVRSRVTPNVEITVKAGTFNTYQYDFNVDAPGDVSTIWVSPGIGLVKSVHMNKVHELVEFNVH